MTVRVLLALVLAALLPAAASAAETKPYIVVFEKSSASGARAATSDLAQDEHFKAAQVYDDSLHGFAAKLDAHDVAAVKDDPRVAAVVPDRPVKASALVPVAPGDNVPLGVRRVGAGTATTARQASTANVAVIDTGIDLSHPDLNAVAGVNCNGTGAPTDGFGHGTHVAGIIGARNQGGDGAVGVAPGTRLWAVRVLNAQGAGYTSNIICGIDWVTSTRTDKDPNNDIRVANMSLGGVTAPNASCGRTVNDPEHIAICNSVAAGVTYVAAAGNSTRDEQSFAPAAYPEVLTVTAVTDTDGRAGGLGARDRCFGNADDTPASYSNWATRPADVAHTIAAPGTCITSTYPGARYATMSGTSMAAPHVAGLVALCMGENGAHGPCWGQTPAKVMSIVMAAAATTAGRAPDQVFSGAPSRDLDGRFYGDLASVDFPGAAGVAPVATSAPVVSGTAATGQTLAGAAGTWSGAGVTTARQWLRCAAPAGTAACAPIAGATGATYVPGDADAGRFLRVRVVATNVAGAAIAVSAATAAVTTPVAPALQTAPGVTGTAVLGGLLTARNGTWSGTAPIAYQQQWERCASATNVATCVAIGGATALTYAPVAADVGQYLRVAFTASNAKAAVVARTGTTAAVTRPASAPVAVAPVNTVLPALSGVVAAGRTLTASAGTWTGTAPAYAYAWQRCTTTALESCLPIAGATGASYALTTADRARYVRVAVTATNAKGSVVARSNAVGPVA
jgi:subtilisin